MQCEDLILYALWLCPSVACSSCFFFVYQVLSKITVSVFFLLITLHKDMCMSSDVYCLLCFIFRGN